MFLALPCAPGMLAGVMELRHLRYFAAVGAAQNVTRAAERLHVSQPALSRQVRDLEEELGFPLLKRTAKAVRLTQAGEVFLREAQATLQRLDQGIQAARAVAHGLTGELHVGYAPSLTVEILPRALRRFRAETPGCHVLLHDLSTEEILAGVREGRLQLGLTVPLRKQDGRGLHFQPLARYPLCAAVPREHPLARARAVKPETLAREPLVVYTRADYPEYHALLAQVFGPQAGGLAIVEEHEGVNSLIAAVEAGRGLALVPSALACLAGPRLKLVPLRPAPPPVIVGAIHLADTLSPAGRNFIAAAEAV